MGSGRVVRVGVLINHWGGHGRAVRGIYSQSDGHGHLADPRTTLPFLTWASVGLGLGRACGSHGLWSRVTLLWELGAGLKVIGF